jgi:hypothetical protein
MNNTSGTGAGWSRNSSVIGVRGKAGPTYGDLEGITNLWGGSGGGGGGAQHQNPSFANGTGSGGSGGGGGGSLTMYVAGGIIGSSGTIDVSGGDGGQGAFRNAYTYYPNWLQSTGGGGGGAGGMMVLISADHIDLSGATVDARGGAGGPHSGVGTTTTCNVCNGGGTGGKGLIFLMDKDGVIGGLIPGGAGSPLPSGAVSYPNHSTGHLVVSAFNGDRFGGSSAITELFPMTAANPEYQPLAQADVKGIVNPGQVATVFMSSARGDDEDPLKPDLATEIPLREMAVISTTGAGGATVDITGNMSDLNPGGVPDREAFVRVKVDFFYDEPVQAALGPFASMDEVKITYVFNG